MTKIGCLTGGGDACGLNAVITALVRQLSCWHVQVWGFRYGWQGLVRQEPDRFLLTTKHVNEISSLGGTMLGTSRENPFKGEGLDVDRKIDNIIRNLREFDGLVVMGGDDTLTVAHKLSQQGVKVIGVPKTMDLDLSGTDYSVGFWSYVESVFDSIKGFRTTCKSHGRIGVCEVFGRHSGFTAAAIGLAADADFVIIPEQTLSLDLMRQRLIDAYDHKAYALLVVSEGIDIATKDQGKIDDHGNELLAQRRIGAFLAQQIEKMTSIETRAYQASHPHRGSPTAYDALVGARLGLKAAEMVVNQQWGQMTAIKGDAIEGELISLSLASFSPRRLLTPELDLSQMVTARNQGKL